MTACVADQRPTRAVRLAQEIRQVGGAIHALLASTVMIGPASLSAMPTYQARLARTLAIRDCCEVHRQSCVATPRRSSDSNRMKLSNGTQVGFRPITPDDAGRLVDAFDR